MSVGISGPNKKPRTARRPAHAKGPGRELEPLGKPAYASKFRADECDWFPGPKQKAPNHSAAPGGADGEAAAVIGSLRVSNIEQIFSRQPCNILVGGVTMRCSMPHEFKVGQTVAWECSPTSESYVVTQQLPERDGAFEYAVTNPTEPY